MNKGLERTVDGHFNNLGCVATALAHLVPALLQQTAGDDLGGCDPILGELGEERDCMEKFFALFASELLQYTDYFNKSNGKAG